MSALLSVKTRDLKRDRFFLSSVFKGAKRKKDNMDSIFPQAFFSCHLNHSLFIKEESCCVLLRVAPRSGSRKRNLQISVIRGGGLRLTAVRRPDDTRHHVAGDTHTGNQLTLAICPLSGTTAPLGQPCGWLVVAFLSYSHDILYFFLKQHDQLWSVIACLCSRGFLKSTSRG